MMTRHQFICVVIYITSKAVIAAEDGVCKCYMLGTVGNIEGESLCDSQTLQCKCHPNVVGENCEKCREGYYGILNGRGCLNCNCNSLGSINKTCNEHTGQCVCKPGFMGFRCDKCSPYSYISFHGECLNCNCNIYGSKDMKCNSSGECTCLDNAEGKHCGQCKLNNYNIEQGCIPCPQCFEFVENAIHEYSKALKIFVDILDNVKNSLHDEDGDEFMKQLNLLIVDVNQLKSNCDANINSTIKLDDIDTLLNASQILFDDIKKLIIELSAVDFKDINTALYNARQNLSHLTDITLECEDILKNATNISKRILRHSKSMTQMAETSIVKCNDIQKNADQFDSIIANVNETCKEACDSAEKFMKNQFELNKKLSSIQQDIINTTSDVNIISNNVNDLHQKTEIVKQDAFALYNLSQNIEIPKLHFVENLESNGDNDFINKTLLEFGSIEEDLKNKRSKIESSMEVVMNKQNVFDEKVTKLKGFENQADNAINTINDILNLAKGDLQFLKDNERQIRHKMQNYTKQIASIKSKIKAVFDHEGNLTKIFNEVRGIIDVINSMQANVSNILKLIEENNENTYKQYKELEELENEQLKIGESLQKYEEQIKHIRKTLDKYQKLNDQTEAMIDEMHMFTVYLSVYPTTASELNEIEQEISLLENMYLTVAEYQKIKNEYEKEVQHIKLIVESLPYEDFCESARNEPKTII